MVVHVPMLVLLLEEKVPPAPAAAADLGVD